ncbi:sulfatase [Prolixibacteraceae bacterium Z1-6]|uniref:Sulfatase n=1 Tax=Draconibacterium aestuarii TaxID=2998507 RepID=A0A9X3J6T2_9BACT|nr:sulfatase [Prolixibacteraceae bacterium Z1-6]
MKRIGILFFALILISFISSGQKGPNILWITIEDTSPQFIGCYENKDASTPIIDRLAGEGVRFTNAFSTGTVCSPSRSTIITGVRTYKMGTGNHRSNYSIPSTIHGFPFYMQQQGYYVTNNAKTDYNVGNVKAFIQEAWHESSAKAGWWNRKPGQPFFSVFNFNESHQSRTMTNSYSWYLKNVWEQLPTGDRIGEDAFEMPPIYRDSPEMRKHFARVYNSIKLTDNRIGELLEKLDKDNLRDSTIIFFYADHGEGEPRGKTNGINYGYRVPFIIWFPEMYKHLSPWGTSGVVTDELVDFEDLAPTLISLAGGTIPDYLKGRVLIGENRSKKVDHLILSADRSDNGIDMVRSITDGKYMYSRNFMPFIPQQRYIRYMEISEIVNQMRADWKADLLNPLQKSIFEARPAEFLFDIENDLWETKNLVDNPKYIKVLAKMRKQLDQQIMEARDVMFLPEYEIAMISKTGTPYEFRMDKTQYPLESIYAAASLSGKRGAGIAEKQIQLLKSKNKIIRYWAIVGLRSQMPETLKPFQNEIEQAMNDVYPPVAVVASAIVLQEFQNPKAESSLKRFCLDENNDIVLLAINLLMYMNDKQSFVETIRATYEQPNRNYNVQAGCMDFLGSLALVPNDFEHKN